MADAQKGAAYISRSLDPYETCKRIHLCSPVGFLSAASHLQRIGLSGFLSISSTLFGHNIHNKQ